MLKPCGKNKEADNKIKDSALFIHLGLFLFNNFISFRYLCFIDL